MSPASRPSESRGVLRTNVVCFVGLHSLCLGPLWTGVDSAALRWFAALYVVQIFGITAGYHRYFAHRSYRMGRGMQLAMALVAMTSGQKGVLWWAARHRWHHRHSDTSRDLHSPRHRGLWMAHVGWILKDGWRDAAETVDDLSCYPELRWLDRHPLLPVIGLGVGVWSLGGPAAFFVGFCWSTIATNHAIFAVNSFAHAHGTRRYQTGDDSRNNWLVALVSFGAGWHNNHHRYPAARLGFRWWELDLTYYGLCLLAWVGLVHDLRVPPARIVHARETP